MYIIGVVSWPGAIPVNNLIGLLRELRLMKGQSSDRYYAAWILILVVIVGSLYLCSAVMMELLSRIW